MTEHIEKTPKHIAPEEKRYRLSQPTTRFSLEFALLSLDYASIYKWKALVLSLYLNGGDRSF